MVSASENELKMDPSKDNELKNLSNRTEELLSRLNELSDNLSSQLHPSSNQDFIKKDTEASELVPSNLEEKDKVTFQQPTFEAPKEKNNYYKIPVNTHYLEKHEKRVQTTGSGENYVTTSSTSFFREQHFHSPNVPSEKESPKEEFVTAKFDDFDLKPNEVKSQQTSNLSFEEDHKDPKNDSDETNFELNKEERLTQPSSYIDEGQADSRDQEFKNLKMKESLKEAIEEAKTKVISSRNPKYKISKSFGKPDSSEEIHEKVKDKIYKTEDSHKFPEKESWVNLDESLKPAAIFSTTNDENKKNVHGFQSYKSVDRNFSEIDARTKEIADELAAKNKEIKDRLSKYSKRVQVSSQIDNLKLFAWLVLLFSPAIPLAVIKDDFILAIGCSSLALFFGIFFSMMALRLVEVSELVRWAHNQILHMQSSVEELNKQNKNNVE
ncbi:MAG: hypothetical protein QNJ31_01940 [Candidatus Caenarcaniphilales bacterium]|nr:hypothetical protein [Candidatus Caenarcaniphilales bacterium]